MKIINYICRIFALILGLGAVVLFFFPFVTMQVGSEAIDATGAQLAFGTTVSTSNASYNLARSVYMLLSIILAALSAITAGVSLGVKKSVGARVVSFLSCFLPECAYRRNHYVGSSAFKRCKIYRLSSRSS